MIINYQLILIKTLCKISQKILDNKQTSSAQISCAMSSIVQLFVGEAGIQLGNTYQELFCYQNSIELNGEIKTNDVNKVFCKSQENGRCIPNSILVDLDSNAINNVKQSQMRSFYDKNNFISSYYNSDKLYSQGYYTDGPALLVDCYEQVRRMVESKDKLQGFQIFHSLGGGTGSGFASLLSQSIKEEFPLKHLLGFSILPEITSDNMYAEQEVCNTMLALNQVQELCDAHVIYNNSKIEELRRKTSDKSKEENEVNLLNQNHEDEDEAAMRKINEMISYSILPLNESLKSVYLQNEFQTNLVPYKTLNLLTAKVSQINYSIEKYTPSMRESALDCMTDSYISYRPEQGQFIGAHLFFNGYFTPSQMNYVFKDCRNDKRISYVDWVPNGIKLSGNENQAKFPGCKLNTNGQSMSSLINNTCVGELLDDMYQMYTNTIKNKANIQKYLDQKMEEQQFQETEYYMQNVILDYVQCTEVDDIMICHQKRG